MTDTSQYQSFPDSAGSSRTLDKLKALGLPDLAGRTFLDVGCNEGFFCGFARFQGASRVVGIDRSSLFIARARERFPDCDFRHQGWETLPEGPFDVILLASALHYAEDQPALVERLVERLSADGVLVLELGIASSTKAEWVRVERGIDKRDFPSMPMLKQMLANYVWKWMGPSIRQQGDPVARHVVHISRRRPVAYLLMQPPGYGKSSLAAGLFPAAGVATVSGDQEVNRIARGESKVPAPLRAAICEDYSPFRIDQVLQRVFDRGLAGDLVDAWLSAGTTPGADIAVDAYVPTTHHAQVEEAVAARGYLPVRLQWERPGPAPMPGPLLVHRAETFYLSMVDGDGGAAEFTTRATGFVDEVALEDGRLLVRGWAVDERGRLPARITVTFAGRRVQVDQPEAELRVDVQKHLSLPHGLVGYRLSVDAGGLASLGRARRGFRVSTPGIPAFQLSTPAARMFAD